MKKVISLGWGVQSFTMATMVALGELEPIDLAIFADTTYESKWTYNIMAKWKPWLNEHGVRTITVRAKHNEVIDSEHKGVHLPVYAKAPDGNVGKWRRQCTDDWKITPIKNYLRSEGWHTTARGGIELWLGITMDEFQRMKDSRTDYITHRWPLIEKKMTRDDCEKWLTDNGFDVPMKSSCYFCPFHTIRYWKELRDANNGDWEKAVTFDNKIRDLREPDRLFLNGACESIEDLANRNSKDIPIDDCDSGFCFI